MTPEEIEQYVLLASNATNLQNQQQANVILNQWISTTDDKTQADSLLLVLRMSRKEVVLFFVLTAFLKLHDTTLDQRTRMRQDLLWLLRNEDCWSPTYLRTKVGVLFASFIQGDYSNGNWPSAFDDLRSPDLLQGAPDILLRTLVALMDDFGHNETILNAQVKGMMRGYAIQNNQVSTTQLVPSDQSLSSQLLKTICSLLYQSLDVCNGSTPPLQLQICVLALTSLKGFFAWVDTSLILDDRDVLNLVFSALAKGSTADSPMADAAVVAVECLQELISRGMEEEKKVAILVHTNMLETIHAHVNLETLDASPIDVVLEVARFIDRTGLEVSSIILEQNGTPDYAKVRSQLLDLFFRCFAFDDIDVSTAVVSLAGSLIPSQGKSQEVVTLSDPVLSQLLSITFQQMRYPDDFQFDYEDEDEAEEEVYRTELRKLNQKFIRAAPDAFLEFICQTLAQLPVPLSAAPTRDIEAALRLVYHYCEGIRPPPGMKIVIRNETFRSLVVALHTSDITMHSHREVLTLYYETAVRYYPLLKEQPDLLQKVLESLTGNRGLSHENPRVRSRCCYMLLRLVKSAGNNSSDRGPNVMRPYVETAISGIQALLGNSSVNLRGDDTLNLFETIGILLGKTGVDPMDQQRLLTQVITPHIKSIEKVLEANNGTVIEDPDSYGEVLSSSIAAIACLSKGFKRPNEPVQMVLLETVEFAGRVLETLPNVEAVRNKTMVLIQRLIQCLEDKVAPALPRLLQMLILYCTQEDILDVAQLFNQVCITYKERSVPLIDGALLPFLQKCFALSSEVSSCIDGTAATMAPHQRTEQLSIQKLIYMVLTNVASNKASAVLYTPTNLPSLERILQSMSDGAIRVEDAAMKKHCLMFFKEILEQWLDSSVSPLPSPTVVTGFIQFIHNVLLLGVFQSFVQSTFSIQDANQWRCVLEVVAIMDIVRVKAPDIYQQQVLVELFSKRLGCPAANIDSLADARDRKAIEASLKVLLQ